jgi:hypothetical protein
MRQQRGHVVWDIELTRVQHWTAPLTRVRGYWATYRMIHEAHEADGHV